MWTFKKEAKFMTLMVFGPIILGLLAALLVPLLFHKKEYPHNPKASKEKVMQDASVWADSFPLHQNHIKQMSLSEKNECEKLLREILRELDSENHCKEDVDCIIIGQNPFSDIIPYPVDSAGSITKKMENYYARCDDKIVQFVASDDLVHTPVCCEGKCMVKSSIRDNVK